MAIKDLPSTENSLVCRTASGPEVDTWDVGNFNIKEIFKYINNVLVISVFVQFFGPQ